MITSIHIKNFSLIENLTIEPRKQMNVITGESGSGKSMVLGALELGLGKRAEQQMFGPFGDKIDVSIHIDITDLTNISKWLTERDLHQDDQDILIIRRVVDKQNRTKAYINDHACTISTLKMLTSKLVNFHGQHENQALLKKEYQIEILDTYADNGSLLSDIRNIVTEWKATQKAINELKQAGQDDSAKALLRYQLQELDQLGLEKDEVHTLEVQHTTLANADKIIKLSEHAIKMIEGGDQNIMSSLAKTLDDFNSISNNPKIKEITACLNDAMIQLSEAQRNITQFSENIENDPEAYHGLEKRLELIYDLARKHHVKPKELFTHIQTLRKQLEGFSQTSEKLSALLTKQAKLKAAFLSLAEKLTLSRQKSASKLSISLTKIIKQLGIKDGKFIVKLAPTGSGEPRPSGLDDVEMLVSTNILSEPLPLNKVASGGELSRISLAIQSIAAKKLLVPILIFDEVDVGISGATAEVVGHMLKKLSANAQMICITHLPQVASLAHQHFKIEKITDKRKTNVSLTLLDPSQRIQEIARLLGGLTITEQTIKHASEMLLNQEVDTTT